MKKKGTLRLRNAAMGYFLLFLCLSSTAFSKSLVDSSDQIQPPSTIIHTVGNVVIVGAENIHISKDQSGSKELVSIYVSGETTIINGEQIHNSRIVTLPSPKKIAQRQNANNSKKNLNLKKVKVSTPPQPQSMVLHYKSADSEERFLGRWGVKSSVVLITKTEKKHLAKSESIKIFNETYLTNTPFRKFFSFIFSVHFSDLSKRGPPLC